MDARRHDQDWHRAGCYMAGISRTAASSALVVCGLINRIGCGHDSTPVDCSRGPRHRISLDAALELVTQRPVPPAFL